MYDDIADIYLEIFPLNQEFLDFLPEYLDSQRSAVLDLGCGPGDYVDYLSRLGHRSVGIDSSSVMIKHAQEKRQGTFFNLSFSETSQLQGDFDCVYCVGNSLSYLQPNDLPAFNQEVLRLLAPSGVFILQVVNWDKHREARSSNFPVNSLSKGRTFHRRYEWVGDLQVIFHTEIRKDGITQKSWADSLYPKYHEAVMADLQSAGLTVTAQFGDYKRAPFDPESSPALILVAQKL
jgi:SAM-dependent methyltransferase